MYRLETLVILHGKNYGNPAEQSRNLFYRPFIRTNPNPAKILHIMSIDIYKLSKDTIELC